jgi:hypothetical protein
MRRALGVLFVIGCTGCGSSSSPSKAPEAKAAPQPVKITQFYAADRKIPRGVKGQLCYGVENADKVELSPAADVVWPSPARCIEISPKQNTTYTLTAVGTDGSRASKTVDVSVGAPPPRIYDLSVNSTQVHPGDQIVVCFKAENVKSFKASPGHYDKLRNCLLDKPTKTTVYKITALGGDNQIDTGTVTVKVK